MHDHFMQQMVGHEEYSNSVIVMCEIDNSFLLLFKSIRISMVIGNNFCLEQDSRFIIAGMKKFRQVFAFILLRISLE